MTTIRDVANRAGVSVATVSAVINDSRVVSERLRKQVNDAIAELDYRPNQIARALYTKRTNTLGLLVPSLDNPFFARLLKVTEDGAHAMGYSVLVGSTDGDPDKALSYGSRLMALGVDGILTTLSWDISTSGLIDELKKHDIPVVGVGGARAVDTIDCFLGGDVDGAAEATRYLMALGHRDIAFIGAQDSRSTELRYEGYRAAHESAGIPLRDELSILINGYSEAHAYQGILSFLGKGSTFSALIAFNDIIAMGAQNALQDQGVSIPDEVSVIGFDNTVAEYTRPKLTTVAFPVDELGSLAVKRLVSRLDGDRTPPATTVIPTRLVVRESTKSHRLPRNYRV